MSLKQLSQPKQCEKYLSTGLIFPDKLGVGSADWIFFFFSPRWKQTLCCKNADDSSNSEDGARLFLGAQ